MAAEDSDDPPGPLSALSAVAVLASLLLCWMLHRVRLRQCEALLGEVARALDDVRRTAEALETRRRIVKAATVTAEAALVEYKTFLKMLQKMQEGESHEPALPCEALPDLPVLRHQIEMETMRAQVSMVQGCLLAMSQEVLNLEALPVVEEKEDDVFSFFHQQRKSYMHMSEELLTLLEKRSQENVNVHSAGERLKLLTS